MNEPERDDFDETVSAIHNFMKDTDKYLSDQASPHDSALSFTCEEQTSGLNDTFDLGINGTLDSRLTADERADDSVQVNYID